MFTITDKAINELKQVLSGAEMPESPAIRVFARSGGCCSSHQLGIEVADLAQTQRTPDDFKGLKVLVDTDAVEIAQNATIDFYDHPENAGFQVLWKKDQEQGSCGCH